MPLSIVKQEPIAPQLSIVSQSPVGAPTPTPSVPGFLKSALDSSGATSLYHSFVDPETPTEKASGYEAYGNPVGRGLGRITTGLRNMVSNTAHNVIEDAKDGQELKGVADLSSGLLGGAPKTIASQVHQGNYGGAAGSFAGMIAPAAIPLAGEAIDMIPSTARAGRVFDSLNTDLANHPVPLNQTIPPLQRATELGGRGGTLPKPVSDLLTRSQAIEPMTYPEIRDYQSNISDLSRDAASSMNGKMLGQVGKIKSGMYGDIVDALEPTGRAQDFADAMQEYKRASQLRDMTAKAGKYAGHAVAGAVGAGGLYEAYKALK